MLKLALVLAVVLFFIWLVAVGVLYGVLERHGCRGPAERHVRGPGLRRGPDRQDADQRSGASSAWLRSSAAINSLLFAVAVTVGAFVYNVSADLVGGIEVTLSERD